MEYLLMTLLIFAAIFFVGYPLANSRRYSLRKFVTLGDEQFERLSNAREQAFDALRDFEFDHATGKLSEGDYRNLRARYESRAAAVLQQLDALTAAHSGARAQGGEPAHSGEPPAPTKLRRQKAAPERKTCRACHAQAEPGDQFCMKCGAKL